MGERSPRELLPIWPRVHRGPEGFPRQPSGQLGDSQPVAAPGFLCQRSPRGEPPGPPATAREEGRQRPALTARAAFPQSALARRPPRGHSGGTSCAHASSSRSSSRCSRCRCSSAGAGPERARRQRLGRQLEGHGREGDRQGLHGEDRHPRGVRGGRHHRPPGQGARGQGQPARGPQLHDHARGAPLHLRRPLREARHGQAAQQQGDREGGVPQRLPPRLVGLRLHDRLPARPREGRDHEVVGSLEALAQGQDRACRTSTRRTSSRSRR